MQPISTLTHRGANSLARSSRVAVQARRDGLISITLPDLAVKVNAIDWRARIGVRAGGDLLGDPVVQGSGCVGGNDQSAACGDGCGVG